MLWHHYVATWAVGWLVVGCAVCFFEGRRESRFDDVHGLVWLSALWPFALVVAPLGFFYWLGKRWRARAERPQE
jgi:hypothetical protein